jgi:thiol-disulfide isomerase/thioredoxin
MKRNIWALMVAVAGMLNGSFAQNLPEENEDILQQDAMTQVYRSRFLNKPLAAFRLTGLDKTVWNLKELHGKVVVINFWFTSCKPCILEMPHLNELVSQNTDKPVVFIAPAPENETQVKKFLKKYNFDYTILPSSLDYINALAIENFPTHIIIDQAGIVRQVFIGYADDIQEKLQAEIDKLIRP